MQARSPRGNAEQACGEPGPQLACGLGRTGVWMSPSQEVGRTGRVEKGLQTLGSDPGRTAAAGMEEEGERPGKEEPHGEEEVAGTGRDKSTDGKVAVCRQH